MPTRSLRRAAWLGLLLIALPAAAAEPPDTTRGDRLLDAYFHKEAQRIADACLSDIKTRADWERQRPELRRQFLDMMGLWPLPPRTNLKPTLTGKLETDAFTVEKLHFQSSPGLYVTANLYVPKKLKGPAPAVLYVCGHGNVRDPKTNISYGSKVSYQHHATWFAEHGYVCLILDTLQLGEIEGIHHGTSRFNLWWWQTLGYTPAGIECWNAMRALDYLQSRKEVDPKRLGVTGRSGGGATSWWLAAADDRVQCIIPVAGISDLHSHVAEGDTPRLRKGIISGHCDCMYMVNTYRWDFALVAALCAPRPLMLGNSDADGIFPVPGYRPLADKVRRIYDLYGAGDRFVLLETAGPHRDTPELRLGAYRWMDRWLASGGRQPAEITEVERPRFTPQELKVYDRPPGDAINTIIHESWIKPARPELPQVPEVARQWWTGQSQEWMKELKDRVFRGWPEPAPALNARPAADVKHKGLRLRAWDFTSQDEVELRLWLLTAEKVEKPNLVVLTAVDEPAWQEFTQELGPAFREVLQLGQEPKLDEGKFQQNLKVLESRKWAFATVAPRGIGPTRWAAPDTQNGKPSDHQIRRRFALLGQTLDGQRIWDVRRDLAVLREVPDLKGAPLWVQGKDETAGLVLYAALFEPDVARVDLWHLPASHHVGPILLNVRRILDVPQAVALALPRKVILYVKDENEAKKTWAWPLQLQEALGQKNLQIRQVGE